MKRTPSGAARQKYLLQKGDASPAVRAGVLVALREFQEGYVRRDTKRLDSFMHRLFPESDDVLLLGTNGGEWIRGFRAVGELIRSDWQYWGDFRFAVEDSIVWGSGDVAWIASVGTVHDSRSDRPVRLSAILTRNGDNWLFRQIQFQWDERDPSPYDLLRPSTHTRLAWLLWQYLRAAWALL